jgi:hypothetical protein
VKAVGQGGRITRKTGSPEVVGNIYDLFAIEYEYPGGIPMYSYCSHVKGTTQDVSETVYGSKGVAKLHDGGWVINGKSVHTKPKGEPSPYVQEHIDLIKSIRDNKPVNELKSVAESTMTAILGRTAVYTGKAVTWDEVLNSPDVTMPEHLKMDMELPVPPVPRPGVDRKRGRG